MYLYIYIHGIIFLCTLSIGFDTRYLMFVFIHSIIINLFLMHVDPRRLFLTLFPPFSALPRKPTERRSGMSTCSLATAVETSAPTSKKRTALGPMNMFLVFEPEDMFQVFEQTKMFQVFEPTHILYMIYIYIYICIYIYIYTDKAARWVIETLGVGGGEPASQPAN